MTKGWRSMRASLAGLSVLAAMAMPFFHGARQHPLGG